MALDTILQMIARPEVADVVGQFQKGRASKLQAQLLSTELAKSQRALQANQNQLQMQRSLISAFDTPQFEEKFREFAVMNPEGASKIQDMLVQSGETKMKTAMQDILSTRMSSPEDQNVYLESLASKYADDPALMQSVVALRNTAPEKRDQMYSALSRLGQQLGLLEPEAETFEQRQQALDLQAQQETRLGKGAQPTPTDIDDYVADAAAAYKQRTGKDMPPALRNKARLDFKRPQAEETAATRWARRNVDAQTAQEIEFQGELGKRIAQIETNAKLIESKGEITPAAKKANAQIKLSGELAKIGQLYNKLAKLGAVVDVRNDSATNILAAARASRGGQFFSRVLGTEEQSIRQTINNIKPLIVQDIRQASEMGARGLDSEKELEFYLQAATDTSRDLQSNIAAIMVLDDAYGTGELRAELAKLGVDDAFQMMQREGAAVRDADIGATETPTAALIVIKGHPEFGDVTEADITQTLQDNPGLTREELLRRLSP